MNSTLRNFLVVIIFAILDQLLKWLVEYTHASVNLGIVFIHEIRNTGASFGMLQGSNALLMLASFVALGIIALNLRKIPKQYHLPVSVLAVGIIGNLVDRLFRGHVVDFFDLGWWPAFNLADSCIFIGVIWIAIEMIKEEKKYAKKRKPYSIKKDYDD